MPDADELPMLSSYKMGVEVNVAASANAPGYVFNGWKTETESVVPEDGKFIVPASQVLFTGSFSPGEAGYQVEYYQQDAADSSKYNQVQDDKITNGSGTTGETAIHEGKAYQGFEDPTISYWSVAGADERQLSEGTILGNGSLVIRYKYNRKLDTPYHVMRYQQSLNAEIYDLVGDMENYTGKTGIEATYKSVTYPGFTKNNKTEYLVNNIQTENHEIDGSGTLLIKVYYDRDANTPYAIKHYKEQLDGNYEEVKKDAASASGKTGEEVTAIDVKSYEGFSSDPDDLVIKYTSGVSNVANAILGDGSLEVGLYYARKSYTVNYTLDESEYGSAVYRFEEQVTVKPEPVKTGYIFGGWRTTDIILDGFINIFKDVVGIPNDDISGKSFAMPAKDINITGMLLPDEKMTYVVNYYQQSLLDETQYELVVNDTDNREGTTDTEAKYIEKTYGGFNHSKTVKSPESGIISGDKSTVISLYYDRNKYEMSYSYTGEPQGLTVPQPEFYVYGANINYADGLEANGAVENHDFNTSVTVRENPSRAGYTFSGWNKTGTFGMPAGDITIEGSFTAIPSGGGSTGGGGGGGTTPSTDRPFAPGGPGDTGNVTIDPEAVPLANLPAGAGNGIDSFLIIDDGNVPLAGLPKTGDRKNVQGLAAMVTGILLAAYFAFSGKKKEEQ